MTQAEEMAEMEMIHAHEEEAARRGLIIVNFCWAMKPDSVASKTRIGVLTTERKAGEYVHRFD
jgi:hypothetical protein